LEWARGFVAGKSGELVGRVGRGPNDEELKRRNVEDGRVGRGVVEEVGIVGISIWRGILACRLVEMRLVLTALVGVTWQSMKSHEATKGGLGRPGQDFFLRGIEGHRTTIAGEWQLATPSRLAEGRSNAERRGWRRRI